MTTRATMIDDIRTDIGDSAFSSDYLQSAITNACKHYQRERFYFSESREKTFATVQGQVWYSSSDDADIGTIKSIDAMVIETSTYDRRLRRVTPEFIEIWTDANASQAEPYNWTYYNRQIGIYPIPDAAYTIRMLGVFTAAAPASDGEADNPWMVEAYNLIRSRVLVDVAMHRQHDAELAQMFRLREQDELMRLRTETAERLGAGAIVPMDM